MNTRRRLYIITVDGVYHAEVVRGISDSRGLTTAYDCNIIGQSPTPFAVLTVLKEDTFKTEEEASKALFMRNLKKTREEQSVERITKLAKVHSRHTSAMLSTGRRLRGYRNHYDR